MVVGWYHSHPGYGCWLSGVDVNTQQSFESLNQVRPPLTQSAHRPPAPSCLWRARRIAPARLKCVGGLLLSCALSLVSSASLA